MPFNISQRGNRRNRFLKWLIVVNVALFFLTAGLKAMGINVNTLSYVVLVPMQLVLAVTILVVVVMAVRKAVPGEEQERAAPAIEPDPGGGAWVLWVMASILFLCVVVMIPAVGVADLSEFGALGLLFILLAVTPIAAIVSIVLPFFASRRRSTVLGWIRSGILASVIIVWLVFALRTGMLG